MASFAPPADAQRITDLPPTSEQSDFQRQLERSQERERERLEALRRRQQQEAQQRQRQQQRQQQQEQAEQQAQQQAQQEAQQQQQRRPSEPPCRVGADERLEAFCILRQFAGQPVTRSDSIALQHIINRVGLNSGLPPEIANYNNATAFISPILSYDDNVNGGNNSKDIILPGGAVFAGNAENVRREDWVAGARLIFSGKWLMGGGQYTTYYLSGSAHQAIQEKDEEGGYVTTALLGHGCYVKHIERWWYWDWCATRSTQRQRQAKSGSTSYTLTLSKVFAGPSLTHMRAAAAFTRIRTSSLRQDQFRASLETIFPNNVFISISQRYGQQILNQNLMKNAFSASASFRPCSWHWLCDRRVRVSWSDTHSSGGRFLGVWYADRTTDYSVSVPVYAPWGIDVTIGRTKTKNTALVHNNRDEPYFRFSLRSFVLR